MENDNTGSIVAGGRGCGRGIFAVGWASSHREAPLISGDPLADNTDVYAFVSPANPDRVTLIANFIPFEEATAARTSSSSTTTCSTKSWWTTTPTPSRTSRTSSASRRPSAIPNTFLYNTGPITSIDSANLNVKQSYSVTRVDGPRRRGRGTVMAENLPTPPVNVGFRSMPNYDAVAAQARAPALGRHAGVRGPARRSVLRRSERVRPAGRPASRHEQLRRPGRQERPQHRHRGADRVAHLERPSRPRRPPTRTPSSACGPRPAARR